jgi:hypothetical protein
MSRHYGAPPQRTARQSEEPMNRNVSIQDVLARLEALFTRDRPKA